MKTEYLDDIINYFLRQEGLTDDSAADLCECILSNIEHAPEDTKKKWKRTVRCMLS